MNLFNGYALFLNFYFIFKKIVFTMSIKFLIIYTMNVPIFTTYLSGSL